jgi:hypothetical protein
MCVWNMSGACLARVWRIFCLAAVCCQALRVLVYHVYGACLARVWRASAACVWCVSGACLARVWLVSGARLVHVCVCVCLARVWSVSGACLARGAYAEGVWNAHGVPRA